MSSFCIGRKRGLGGRMEWDFRHGRGHAAGGAQRGVQHGADEQPGHVDAAVPDELQVHDRHWQPVGELGLQLLPVRERHSLRRRVRDDRPHPLRQPRGLPQDREINAKWAVAPHSTWSYKRSEVPANWYSGDVSQWETAITRSSCTSRWLGWTRWRTWRAS